MIRDEIKAMLVKKAAAKLDSEIEGALSAVWSVWSMEDVERRCCIMGRPGSPIQTLYADGVPILEIHPVQVETVRTGVGWELRATQNFRRLHVSRIQE
jgi:hypothetical protein